MKKLILFSIPLSVCNLRCHYCYLAQRPESYQGVIPEMRYDPEQVAYAMRPERLGGECYFNFCADGETLLLPRLSEYVDLLANKGHYLEIVTNMTLTKQLNSLLDLGEEVLGHVEFKCSFHYLELKRKGLLDRFADNVQAAWDAGASCNIEVTPSDELIPYIPELKEFSMEHFGALPQLTIARDDRTAGIVKLTSLSEEEYRRTWSQFHSPFWEFKETVFGVRQTGFCEAGAWSYYVNMATGDATRCYDGRHLCNVYENLEKPLPEKPIGRCPLAHCYNAHVLLTLGLIDGATDVRYGNIRDREKTDGTHWLQPELKEFFNGKLGQENERTNAPERVVAIADTGLYQAALSAKRVAKRALRK